MLNDIHEDYFGFGLSAMAIVPNTNLTASKSEDKGTWGLSLICHR